MFRLANFSGSEETASPVSEDSDFDFANASFAAIARHRSERAQTTTSPAWRLSVTYAILTALHFAICGFVTFLLLLTLPKASQPPLPHTPDPAPGPHDESKDVRVVRLWATFLGILSTVLALFQYLVSPISVYQLRNMLIPMHMLAADKADMATEARRKSLDFDDGSTGARVFHLCLLAGHEARG